MKKRVKFISLILFSFTCVVVFKTLAFAENSSVTIKTRVGNPPEPASSCPIPGGVPSCGSERVPVSTSTSNGLCGHCGPGYESYTCNYEGIHYAIDIPGSPLQAIIMPSVDGARIKWVFDHQSVSSDNITAIQYYGGTDENTGEQYWIQFHHTAPGSGEGTKYSGDEGAKICQQGCSTGSGPHVHIEFAKITADGKMLWQDAPLFFCTGA